MRYEIIFRPEAEADLFDAVNWYEVKVKSLGSHFLLNVEAAVESILRTPEAFTPIYKNTRRALVRKFPFGIHYLIDGDKIIVLAVFHVKRNPNELKKRSS